LKKHHEGHQERIVTERSGGGRSVEWRKRPGVEIVVNCVVPAARRGFNFKGVEQLLPEEAKMTLAGGVCGDCVAEGYKLLSRTVEGSTIILFVQRVQYGEFAQHGS